MNISNVKKIDFCTISLAQVTTIVFVRIDNVICSHFFLILRNINARWTKPLVGTCGLSNEVSFLVSHSQLSIVYSWGRWGNVMKTKIFRHILLSGVRSFVNSGSNGSAPEFDLQTKRVAPHSEGFALFGKGITQFTDKECCFSRWSFLW